jgi:uncharacterized protein DUF6064
MGLPFSEQQFFDVLGAYNAVAWPVEVVLWIATLWLGVRFVRGHVHSAALNTLAAVHWAWSGLIYHAMFFSRINPAAWMFAALFLAQACAFVWWGTARRRLVFEWGHTIRHALAGVLFTYALAYPALVLATGHQYPRAPMFAVPCPTTIFTAALLLTAARPFPAVVFLGPVVWAAIAGSAAFLLDVTPDLMLFVAGLCLAIYGALPMIDRVRSAARRPAHS